MEDNVLPGHCWDKDISAITILCASLSGMESPAQPRPPLANEFLQEQDCADSEHGHSEDCGNLRRREQIQRRCSVDGLVDIEVHDGLDNILKRSPDKVQCFEDLIRHIKCRDSLESLLRACYANGRKETDGTGNDD